MGAGGRATLAVRDARCMVTFAGQGRNVGRPAPRSEVTAHDARLHPHSMPAEGEPAARADVGERLRRVRLEAGLTQEQLAVKVGRRKNWLSDIERGRRGIDVHTLQRVADLMGHSIEFFTNPGFRSKRREEMLRPSPARIGASSTPASPSAPPPTPRWMRHSVARSRPSPATPPPTPSPPNPAERPAAPRALRRALSRAAPSSPPARRPHLRARLPGPLGRAPHRRAGRRLHPALRGGCDLVDGRWLIILNREDAPARPLHPGPRAGAHRAGRPHPGGPPRGRAHEALCDRFAAELLLPAPLLRAACRQSPGLPALVARFPGARVRPAPSFDGTGMTEVGWRRRARPSTPQSESARHAGKYSR